MLAYNYCPKIHCALSQAIARGLGMAIPAAA